MSDRIAEIRAMYEQMRGGGSSFGVSDALRRAKARKNLTALLSQQFPGMDQKTALATFREQGPPQEKYSVAGTALRSAAANALPTAAAIAGGAGAARLGRALGPIPAAVAGIGGAITSAYAANAGQQSLLDKYAPKVKEELAAAREQNPWAYAAGELIPQLATARPSLSGMAKAAGGLRALAQYRLPAKDQASALFTAGLGAGLSFVSGLGSSKLAGQDVDWGNLALQTAAGATFTKPTKLGQKMGLPPEVSGEPDPNEVAEAIATLKSKPQTLPSFEENVRMIKLAKENLAKQGKLYPDASTVQMQVGDLPTISMPTGQETLEMPLADQTTIGLRMPLRPDYEGAKGRMDILSPQQDQLLAKKAGKIQGSRKALPPWTPDPRSLFETRLMRKALPEITGSRTTPGGALIVGAEGTSHMSPSYAGRTERFVPSRLPGDPELGPTLLKTKQRGVTEDPEFGSVPQIEPPWMGRSPAGGVPKPPRFRPSGGGAGRRGGGMRPPEQETFLSRVSSKFANGVGRAASYIRAGMPSRTASGWDEGRAGIETGLSPEQAAASANAIDDGIKTRPMPEFERQYLMKHGKSAGFDPRGVPTFPEPGAAKVTDVGFGDHNLIPLFVISNDIANGTKEGWHIVDKVNRAETDKRALGAALLMGDEAGNAHNELTKNYGVAPTTWSLRRIMKLMRPNEQKYLFAALENKPASFFKNPAEQAEFSALIQGAHDGSNPSFQAAVLKTRELLDNVADILKLEPGQRLKDYFPHIFDRATLVADLKAKKADILKAGVKVSGGQDYLTYLDTMLNKLQDKNNKARYIPDDVLRDIPDEALFNNVKHRVANLDSYVKDPVKALEVYIKGASRKAAFDAYSPKLQELFQNIKKNTAVTIDGGKANVSRAYQSAVQTYLDNFAGRAGSMKLADDSMKMIFPEFDKLHDPDQASTFTRFFKTLNHHLLLGMNPGYAIRNMAVGRINTYSYTGLPEAVAAEKMLAQHMAKKVSSGKGVPLVEKLLRAKGLEADIPHEDWNLAQQIRGGNDINKWFSAASHWSEWNIRAHAALAGALKAEKQLNWATRNSKLVLNEAATPQAAEAMQKAGLTFGDALRPVQEQLGDLRTALKSYLGGKQDVAVKESYMFDQGYLAARETQHSYGTAAPTWLRAKHSNLGDMATLYQSWFTKQLNFFWNKLDKKSKAKFLGYTAAFGGGSGVPLVQWAYENSPDMRAWINQAVQGEHDDETEVPWKTFLLQGLSGVVGLPSMASAVGLGGLPDAVTGAVGLGRSEPGQGVKAIGQAIGGPVLGGLAQTAYNVGGAALGAPEGLGGEAAMQAFGEANLPIRAALDPATGLKKLLGAEDKRPKIGRDGLANTATKFLLGSTQEEQWAKTYVPEAYKEKDRRKLEEDLTIEAALRKHGPQGFEQILQEVQAKMPNRISPDRVQNRIIQETTPKQYWGLWTLKPDGGEKERQNLRLAIKQIGRDKSGAPWAQDLRRKLEADILQSEYEDEKSKPDRDDAVLHALRLQLSMEYGRKVGDADAMTKRSQKVLQEYQRFKMGQRVKTTQKQLEAYQRLAGMQSQ